MSSFSLDLLTSTVILPILALNRSRTAPVPYPTVSNRIRPVLIGYKTGRSETVGYSTGAVRLRLLARIGRITVCAGFAIIHSH
jgi:hypothetical protein